MTKGRKTCLGLLLAAMLSGLESTSHADLGASCAARSLLGLCAYSGEKTLLGRSLLPLGSRVAAPNRLLSLVKLFIADMQIASLGNVRIKLHLSIQ